MPIEIRRRTRDARNEQPVLYDNDLLKSMRRAGIPATGIISVNGVSYGKLEMFCDVDTGEHVYRWFNNEELGIVDEDPL